MTLQLRILGEARIETGSGPLRGRAAHRRRLAVLALLAASPRGTMRREKVIGLLWPDSPTEAARHLLSESLYTLRREISEELFLVSGDELQLNPAALSCDLAEFRAALAQREPARAVEHYGGPFLDGFYVEGAPDFERWVEDRRQEIGQEYAGALETLAEAAVAAEDHTAAAVWWGRLALHDPYSGRVALRLMETLAQAGERARAVRFASAYAARLREDLGVEPDAEVAALAERLRTESSRPRSSGSQDPPSPGLSSWPSAPPTHGATAAASPELSPELELVRKIGEGSYASVYLAREPALGRLVAVKVLAERYTADETAQLRFEREARAAARIQHPGVATVFRVGRTPAGLPFIILPYVAGGSLEERLAAAGRLAENDARRYVGQVAAALAAAHRLGIVHRDVRPANLLYDRDTDRVLLTDFGLAAVLETGSERVQKLTRPGEKLGNPAYASPEQLRGEPVTERADVYSLGVVAFELLTGRLPFDAATPLQMTVAHVREEPRRVSHFRAGVDAELDGLVDRCLAKRPEHRPFALDVADALGWS